MVTLEEIRAAADRIRPAAVRTPLVRVSGERLRAAGVPPLPFALWVKVESAQPIGSFKLRGAYNMAAQLPAEALTHGLITYSSGNHAQGVAYAARALGVPALIVMPSNAPGVKIEATRALGAEIVMVGVASSERKARAEELAAEHGYTVVPPYDHPAIIAGQATCGLEIVEQAREAGLEAPGLVLAPVSGGGLLSGVASAVKLAAAEGGGGGQTEVWGVEPELAGDAAESFRTGELVRWPAEKTSRTLGDGLRTESLGRLNFAHIRRFVDGIVTVSEEQIVGALRIGLQATGLGIEPSGAVTLAAALYAADRLPEARAVVAVISGGNIDPALRAALTGEAAPADPVPARIRGLAG
ncbi:MAG: threonine/serine dehydratase [Gluconacetobacter diazotrophicus]|nr:threonine/serine dehydratase [Gluconacetobacter diazotrophicus]